MQELGQLLLLVAFFVTLATALTAIAGALTRNARLMTGARYGLYAAALLYVAMSLVLLQMRTPYHYPYHGVCAVLPLAF